MSAIVVNGNHLSVFDVETLTQLHHRQLLQNDDCFMCEWNVHKKTQFLFLTESNHNILTIVSLANFSTPTFVARDICVCPQEVLKSEKRTFLLTCRGDDFGNPPKIISFTIRVEDDSLMIDKQVFWTENSSPSSGTRPMFVFKYHGPQEFLISLDANALVLAAMAENESSSSTSVRPHEIGCGTADSSGQINLMQKANFDVHYAFICTCMSTARPPHLLLFRVTEGNVTDVQTHPVNGDALVLSSRMPGAQRKTQIVYVALLNFADGTVTFIAISATYSKVVGRLETTERGLVLGINGVFTEKAYVAPFNGGNVIIALMSSILKGEKNFPLISLSKRGEISSIASLKGSFVAVAVDDRVIVVDTRDASKRILQSTLYSPFTVITTFFTKARSSPSPSENSTQPTAQTGVSPSSSNTTSLPAMTSSNTMSLPAANISHTSQPSLSVMPTAKTPSFHSKTIGVAVTCPLELSTDKIKLEFAEMIGNWFYVATGKRQSSLQCRNTEIFHSQARTVHWSCVCKADAIAEILQQTKQWKIQVQGLLRVFSDKSWNVTFDSRPSHRSIRHRATILRATSSAMSKSSHYVLVALLCCIVLRWNSGQGVWR
ncbi:uncharacterized protein [Oscarella lobularis]